MRPLCLCFSFLLAFIGSDARKVSQMITSVSSDGGEAKSRTNVKENGEDRGSCTFSDDKGKYKLNFKSREDGAIEILDTEPPNLEKPGLLLDRCMGLTNVYVIKKRNGIDEESTSNVQGRNEPSRAATGSDTRINGQRFKMRDNTRKKNPSRSTSSDIALRRGIQNLLDVLKKDPDNGSASDETRKDGSASGETRKDEVSNAVQEIRNAIRDRKTSSNELDRRSNGSGDRSKGSSHLCSVDGADRDILERRFKDMLAQQQHFLNGIFAKKSEKTVDTPKVIESEDTKEPE